ncbi:conserved oligomeric Golgi complex subunit 2-like isoform X2 [Mustela lutreola]|uniref:conserved oligomeric Golgi complex subunit 2-like isoform X2 n=1 Tax=Mustela lutreola TaxID=9666 RepID=UPI002797B23F|nr:conserved oligomeric Golgi complex subunit 2-like isoform X2 [Mustela lutreola]XP_059026491.1 conserved oligomeric Golgi complex subunit 2-like isoform X2 [Mustela lutreola]
MERSRMNLPKEPDTLCFDKEEFMKEDFDVNHFLSVCRKRVQLEELRGDLELYYKLLKTAMVELINKDYADFVNLSTNLVGMDKALNQLSVPLGQLREEVLSLRSSVSEGIRAVDERMCKQEDIRKKKRIAGITAMLQQSLGGLLLEGFRLPMWISYGTASGPTLQLTRHGMQRR